MLSQRFAIDAALALLGDALLRVRSATAMAESRDAFEESLTYLIGLPLIRADTHAVSELAGIGWLSLLAVTKPRPGGGTSARTKDLRGLAKANESLLAVLEQLSANYARSMQMLTGA